MHITIEITNMITLCCVPLRFSHRRLHTWHAWARSFLWVPEPMGMPLWEASEWTRLETSSETRPGAPRPRQSTNPTSSGQKRASGTPLKENNLRGSQVIYTLPLYCTVQYQGERLSYIANPGRGTVCPWVYLVCLYNPKSFDLVRQLMMTHRGSASVLRRSG